LKKVTAFIGSQQKRLTYRAVQEFETNLKSLGEVQFEYVFLKDYRLEFCKSCCMCFEKGEDSCPLKDDRDALLKKIYGSDGVIIATPNYSFQVSAQVKNLLDRMSFVLHRPRFFGKTFTAVVAQGMFGGKKIQKYLQTIAGNWGFRPVDGCTVRALGPADTRDEIKLARTVKKASARFYKELTRPAPAVPSLFRLMIFRLARKSIQNLQNEKFRDYRYYRDNGWFTSDYYYGVPLGIFKKLAGALFDLMGRILFRSSGEKGLHSPEIKPVRR
jgi:multimeric flavodoxin WrbA